jgi:glutamyl-tRNA reductase
MPGSTAPLNLLVLGINHRTPVPELRDAFALIEAGLGAALEELRHAVPGEAALIATCDRVELITTWTDSARTEQALAALLATRAGIDNAAVASSLYRHQGDAALRHLFAVASALDSLVIGEPHVLGQVKAAYRAAAEAGLAGAELEAIFAAAFAAARRVRRETRIAERPVTIAAAALQLARDIHGDVGRCRALLLGPGEMGELMAEHFRRGGLASLVVCGPLPRAAQAAARQLDDALAAADIVIAALGSGRVLLPAARIAAALRRRPTRPIFVIDAAVPADVEPAVNDLDGAFLYDLGDLERAALAGRATRAAAAAEAWQIIDAEVAAFAGRRAERRAVPAVSALRAHVEALRQQALADAGGDAAEATRLLANRLLHDPFEVLREAMAAIPREAEAMEELLRRLFRLDRGERSE